MGVLFVVHAKHNRAVDAELQHFPCSEGLFAQSEWVGTNQMAANGLTKALSNENSGPLYVK